VAPCNEVTKYFYMDAHLQYMGQKAMVQLFFHLASKWPKWCAQTLHPFSHILKIFSCIGAPILAPHSDNFQICFIHLKGLFLLENLCKPHLNLLKNTDAISLNNATASHVTVKHSSVIYVSNTILHPLTPMYVVHFPPNFAR